jgi:DNA-binding NtrC family response regulator
LVRSGQEALRLVQRICPDLILLDLRMPEMDGLETCRRLQAQTSTKDVPVLFLTASNDTRDIVEAFRVGGVDYITKPFYQEEVLSRVENHLRTARLMRELGRKNRALHEEIERRERLGLERDHLAGRLSHIADREAQRWGIEGFLGNSPTVNKILKEVNMLRDAPAATVLITGENGTGKELIARAIHFGSARADGPFVPVNCSAIPEHLGESLFFGHKRGAFTGANRDQNGYFELADGGTLFLDEIGDMAPSIQPLLLRILEDGLVQPLGATSPRPVNVRIVSATNQDLQGRIQTGAFRQDLYFRLARFHVVAPPLRERQDDIPLLAAHFLRLFANETAMPEPEITPSALAALQAYTFPGNVRELKNIIERALLESGGSDLQPEHLHFFNTEQTTDKDRPSVHQSSPSPHGEPLYTLPLKLSEAETLVITQALQKTRGNISAAARLLDINRHKLNRMMARLDLRPPMY